MATMICNLPTLGSLQFEDVEENVEFVKVGVKVANQSSLVVRVIWKTAFLNFAFSRAIAKQDKLIDSINSPHTQNFSAEQLDKLAARIEHLVSLNDDLLVTAAPRTREFKPWMDMLAQIRVQRDTLESIAESLHSALDSEHQTLLITAIETLYA